MKSTVKILGGLALVALLAACATTPESRIRNNRSLFDSYPAGVQAKIQQGQIAPGFTPDMVEMALDKPDHIYDRETTGGVVEVWSYVGYVVTMSRQHVMGRIGAPDAYGFYHTYPDGAWADVEHRREFDRLRVEFQNGKVTAIESLER